MKNKSFVALGVALLLFVAGYGAMNAQTIRQNFEWIIAKRITVTGINGMTVQRGGLTVTDGGITVSDDNVTVVEGITAADVTVSDDINTADLIGSTYTTITLGYAGTITPTGMYQQLTAAAARGTSSVANPTAGRIVTLVNIGSNTITLTDTGTLKLSGNVALGQYDAVTLFGDGTNWIQVSTSNN